MQSADDVEEALLRRISKFVNGLEKQERSCFKEINSYLQRLPVAASEKTLKMTHAEAIKDQFLPKMYQ